jgi:hypothetical protein
VKKPPYFKFEVGQQVIASIWPVVEGVGRQDRTYPGVKLLAGVIIARFDETPEGGCYVVQLKKPFISPVHGTDITRAVYHAPILSEVVL